MKEDCKTTNWCLRCGLPFESYGEQDICPDCIADDINAVFGARWIMFKHKHRRVLVRRFRWRAENLREYWWLPPENCHTTEHQPVIELGYVRA